MKYIEGKDRDQTEFFCLNEAIGQDNVPKTKMADSLNNLNMLT